MKKIFKKLIITSLFFSPFAMAETVPPYDNHDAMIQLLSSNAAKKTLTTFTTATVKIVPPPDATKTYISDKRSGQLEMSDYLKDKYYWFHHPTVCDIETEGGKHVIRYRCPNTFGFPKFSAQFESGYPSEKIENLSQIFPADNQWHEIKVKVSPYEHNNVWANMTIIPLF